MAEAAETDAFLCSFLRNRIGVSDNDKIGAVLIDFRKFREARGGVTAPRPEHFREAKTP